VEPVADLDVLAASLRERLLSETARDGPGDVEGRIRALVEREAALLDAGARDELVALVAERSAHYIWLSASGFARSSFFTRERPRAEAAAPRDR
jgi:hypothetical protein